MIKVAIGQDSHCIDAPAKGRPLILGGVKFDGDFCLRGNSDADVVLHAVTNAISGITGNPVLGKEADLMCARGITDSHAYLQVAFSEMMELGMTVSHLSIAIECERPKIMPKLDQMRNHIAECLNTKQENVAITATTGEGLTEFGKGRGIQVLAVLTVFRQD